MEKREASFGIASPSLVTGVRFTRKRSLFSYLL